MHGMLDQRPTLLLSYGGLGPAMAELKTHRDKGRNVKKKHNVPTLRLNGACVMLCTCCVRLSDDSWGTPQGLATPAYV